ncbi:hypothetical protein [Undibacterium pigrum]|uniref:Uncharacterized protein n=1 Tax=Undibacterium pigrum TaxID=401470 RepID=A0A318JB75_9BURK|nr:hypothetical protein [Undibacterium pigrum]PXX45307.1 hypothetical protein DFR42_102535 [Undibacterium pigrum]
MKTLLASSLLALGLLSFTSPIWAFKLKPEGSFIERKLATRSQSEWEKLLAAVAFRGIHKVGESVHEEITNRILGCEGDADICGAPDYEPKFAYVLAGVRWNDDPPFRFERGQGDFGGCQNGATVRLNTFPRCWANVFKDGEKRSVNGVSLNADTAPLLVRSHFGDMQFLHAMASKDKEDADKVLKRILVWAEFTWRTSLGEFPLSATVKDVAVPGISEFFQTKGWSVQDLFALGNPHVRKPDNMAELAFGSLLHVVEDSFAGGHVERATPDERNQCPKMTTAVPMPGKILEFHSYINQDSKKHGDDDVRNAFSAAWSGARPNVLDVGRTLNTYFVRRATWDEVKPYIECIFTLHENVRAASAGEKYARD